MASNGLNLYSSSFALSRSRGHYGFHCLNPFMTNGNMLDLISSPSNKLCLSFKVDGRARAVQISGEGNFLSYSSNKAVSGLGNDDKQANQPNGTEIQPDAVALATLFAEIIPTSMGFYSDDDEFDLDCPTEGFSSIPEAIEDIHQGKFVIVVDDEDKENEGDLIMAASLVTPEAMAFIVKRFLDSGEGGVALSFFPDETQVEDIDISSTGLDMKQLQILGPCNGVVCLTRFALNSSSTKTIGARSANCFVRVAARFLCELVLVAGKVFGKVLYCFRSSENGTCQHNCPSRKVRPRNS